MSVCVARRTWWAEDHHSASRAIAEGARVRLQTARNVVQVLDAIGKPTKMLRAQTEQYRRRTLSSPSIRASWSVVPHGRTR